MGRFELLEEIGRGRVGPVWRSRDMGTGTTYVIKLVDEPAPDAAARLVADARAWRWVRHRNLVPVTEVLDDGGLLGAVCPYVEGTPLSDILRDGAAMDLAEAIPLIRAVVDALAVAHAADRPHGALTPANVLLEIDDLRINPRVTDCGLAVALGCPVETVPERARYVAPEVGVDGRGSARADVFSLGVMLYEMVAGRPPFTDRVVDTSVAWTPLDQVAPDCPTSLARLVDAALEFDPERRIASISAFRAALQPIDRWISDEPTQPASMLEWGERTPARPSIRSRTLPREPSQSTAPAPPPVPDGPPTIVPVERPVVRPPGRAEPPIKIEVPASAVRPEGGRPAERPAPKRAEHEVIQVAASQVHEVKPELEREHRELTARPSLAARFSSLGISYVIGPILLLAGLAGIQLWRAGVALHDGRLAALEARAEVDAELAEAGGYIERLVGMGANRQEVEPVWHAALEENDLERRVAALGSVREILAGAARKLQPRTPDEQLAARTVRKGVEALGAHADEQRAAARALAVAEDMPLAGLADSLGVAADPPLPEVQRALMGSPLDDARAELVGETDE